MTTGLESLTNVLGRSLTQDEQDVIDFLSPQGIAKINSDICKGVDLEKTLAELRSVFESMKRRRQLVERSLPDTAQVLMRRMNRPASTDEMLLLAEVPPGFLLTKINNQMNQGEEFEDILEDMAVEHRQKQMLFDAQRLANDEGRVVSISRLAPTAPTAANMISDVVSPSAASIRANNKIRLGLAPIATWFEERPRTPSVASTPTLTAAPSSDRFVVGTTLSPSTPATLSPPTITSPPLGPATPTTNNKPTSGSAVSTPRSALKQPSSARRFPSVNSFNSETSNQENNLACAGLSFSSSSIMNGHRLSRTSQVSFTDTALSTSSTSTTSFSRNSEEARQLATALGNLDTQPQRKRPMSCSPRLGAVRGDNGPNERSSGSITHSSPSSPLAMKISKWKQKIGRLLSSAIPSSPSASSIRPVDFDPKPF